METANGDTLARLSAQLAAAVAVAAASVVYVDGHPRRDASGIAWDEHHVVTADHAIDRDDDIPLLLDGGSTASGRLVGRDAATDLALLRTDATLVPAHRAEPGALAVGHLVLAVGRDEDGQPAASFGVISSLDGPWRTWRGGTLDRFIRPDVNIYSGFSGGALVDSHGGLIGLNTWGLSRRTALTVPVTTIERTTRTLASGGRARSYLGVALQAIPVPQRLRERYHLAQDTAVVVVDAAAGGPAESAGIALGDVLLAFDGVAIEDPSDVHHAVGGCAPGAVATLRLLRAGELREIRVTLTERSPDGK